MGKIIFGQFGHRIAICRKKYGHLCKKVKKILTFPLG